MPHARADLDSTAVIANRAVASASDGGSGVRRRRRNARRRTAACDPRRAGAPRLCDGRRARRLVPRRNASALAAPPDGRRRSERPPAAPSGRDAAGRRARPARTAALHGRTAHDSNAISALRANPDAGRRDASRALGARDGAGRDGARSSAADLRPGARRFRIAAEPAPETARRFVWSLDEGGRFGDAGPRLAGGPRRRARPGRAKPSTTRIGASASETPALSPRRSASGRRSPISSCSGPPRSDGFRARLQPFRRADLRSIARIPGLPRLRRGRGSEAVPQAKPSPSRSSPAGGRRRRTRKSKRNPPPSPAIDSAPPPHRRRGRPRKPVRAASVRRARCRDDARPRPRTKPRRNPRPRPPAADPPAAPPERTAAIYVLRQTASTPVEGRADPPGVADVPPIDPAPRLRRGRTHQERTRSVSRNRPRAGRPDADVALRPLCRRTSPPPAAPAASRRSRPPRRRQASPAPPAARGATRSAATPPRCSTGCRSASWSRATAAPSTSTRRCWRCSATPTSTPSRRRTASPPCSAAAIRTPFRPGGGSALTIVRADGETLAVDGHAQAILWDGAPATLIALRRSAEAEIGTTARRRSSAASRATDRRASCRRCSTCATDGAVTLDSRRPHPQPQRLGRAAVRLRGEGGRGRKRADAARAAEPSRRRRRGSRA